MKAKLPIPPVLGLSSGAFQSIREHTGLSLEQRSSQPVQIASALNASLPTFFNQIWCCRVQETVQQERIETQPSFPSKNSSLGIRNPSVPPVSLSLEAQLVYGSYCGIWHPPHESFVLFIDIMSSWINVSLFFCVSQVRF